MRVICPHHHLKPSPEALVSARRGTLPGRQCNTVSLHTGLDPGQARGRASRLQPLSGAVNGCPS